MQMLKSLSIRTKLIVMIMALVLLAMGVAGYLSYSLSVRTQEKEVLGLLEAAAAQKAGLLERFVRDVRGHVALVEGLKDQYGASIVADGAALLARLQEGVGAGRVILADPGGAVLLEVPLTGSLANIRQLAGGYDEELLAARDSLIFSRVYGREGRFYLSVGAPLPVHPDDTAALVFLEYDLGPLYDLLLADEGIGRTAETVVAQRQGNRAVFVAPLRNDAGAVLEKGVFDGDSTGMATREASLGRSGSGFNLDYRKVPTLAVWRPVPGLDWGLTIKIDRAELQAAGFSVLRRYAGIGLVILLLALLATFLFARYITAPLLALKTAMASLSKGILPEKIEVTSDDEIGKMAETTAELVASLKQTAVFAEKIGRGDLRAEFTPLSANDILGNALLNMRQNLLNTEQRDAQRNWIVTGVAEISEILRSHDTLEDLGDAVIAYLTEKVGAVQGAFYVVNDDHPEEEVIELKAAYAYNRKKYLNGRFRFAQGLVGQAAAEQDSILRLEIPDDYVSITSGILGDQRPKCLLITPFITNEKVYGVVELAAFRRFSEGQIKFVEELSLILARTIFNIKVNERTRRLLDESRKMSRELQEQQEILQQNAEEMAATQEELRRTNQRLEFQIEEVNRTQNRMQTLLENASEVIAIYEEVGTIRYISPSVEKILGYLQTELIGISDAAFVLPESLPAFRELFAAALNRPYESVTTQYEYIKKNGEPVWLEATATNLLADPAIQGIVVNSRDITERRRAEREERLRSKMQSLSENSPDLITRLTQEGEFFYINPMIEHYTGMKPSDFLNRKLTEVDLDAQVREEWSALLRDAEAKQEKIARELEFPSVLGRRVMQINAIPEFDDDNRMESVLVVSHDITERKQIELEIQATNRKITESINYARRIQGAILPNNDVIRSMLPESFIFYKARDVVSGDFPWFTTHGDQVYFAAVDCTGHGVPGALISLIGYFLLNDIVKGRQISDPGAILDALDRSVTRTLRQDIDNSQTKDGMDIALCRIDLKEGLISYAGAHRPLYAVQGGEFVEIKGDKFPIGGGIYKNQTKFASSTLQMNKGDSVFFCSDGFVDQFGGPENRKFGPKRLRELVMEHHVKPMDELYRLFDGEWHAWKGNQKQTDDVLLMGMRF
jgi:PAS domain S-box-containing protein